MSIKKYTREEIEEKEDKTDYERLKIMSEEEVAENAKTDPDAPLQSEKDLDNFRPARKRGKKDE